MSCKQDIPSLISASPALYGGRDAETKSSPTPYSAGDDLIEKADIAYVMSAFTTVESNTADVVLDSAAEDYSHEISPLPRQMRPSGV